MAKREISSTLKNLKFMQRAAQKDEKLKKEEDPLPAADFPSSTVVKRCVVVVEGDPHPGATRGRMSFLSFNPSIDKLNGEVSDHSETGSAAANSGRQNEATPVRENGLTKYRHESEELDDSSSVGYGDFKRKKKAEAESEPQHLKKSRTDDQDTTPSSSCSSQKKHKHGNLDWSVLRPPKHQTKKR